MTRVKKFTIWILFTHPKEKNVTKIIQDKKSLSRKPVEYLNY